MDHIVFAMPRKFDFVIVGSGLTGSTIARILCDAGKSVLVLERRSEIGGNVADYKHPSGIHVHKYGPHLFRTSSDAIWQFVTRFATFYPYKHIIKSYVDGGYENWPIAASYIRRVCGDNWSPEMPTDNPRNFEEAALSLMPRAIYDRFIMHYTRKQWGRCPTTLDAQLCKRFDVRHDDNPYLTPNAKYQGIPQDGYSSLVQQMLKGIPVVLNFDFLADRTLFRARELTVFTGPIDEYFNWELGRLMYRGQKRTVEYLSDTDWALPCGQVNYPDERPMIRQIEWKHIMRREYAERIRGTVVTTEVPHSPESPDEYEYPFPSAENDEIARGYKRMLSAEPGVIICGRLGEYKYYDMDQAIGRAMIIARKIVNREIVTGCV